MRDAVHDFRVFAVPYPSLAFVSLCSTALNTRAAAHGDAVTAVLACGAVKDAARAEIQDADAVAQRGTPLDRRAGIDVCSRKGVRVEYGLRDRRSIGQAEAGLVVVTVQPRTTALRASWIPKEPLRVARQLTTEDASDALIPLPPLSLAVTFSIRAPSLRRMPGLPT